MLQFKLNDSSKKQVFSKNSIINTINIDVLLINFLLRLISLINNKFIQWNFYNTL